MYECEYRINFSMYGCEYCINFSMYECEYCINREGPLLRYQQPLQSVQGQREKGETEYLSTSCRVTPRTYCGKGLFLEIHRSLYKDMMQKWVFKISFDKYIPRTCHKKGLCLDILRKTYQGCMVGKGLNKIIPDICHFFYTSKIFGE